MKQPITVTVVTNKGECAERITTGKNVGLAVSYMVNHFERSEDEEVVRVMVNDPEATIRAAMGISIWETIFMKFRCQHTGIFPKVYDCQGLIDYAADHPDRFADGWHHEECENCKTSRLLHQLRGYL